MTRASLTREQFRRAFLAALRSGLWAQGEGLMCRRRGDGSFCFCVLGVMQDLFMRLTGVGQWRQVRDSIALDPGCGTACPHDEVIELLGLPDGVNWLTLSRLNDTQKWSFRRIAAWLERRWRAEAAH